MAGYIVLGTGFGILLQSKGYAWYWAAFMSVAVYAGSMQYVAVDLIAAGASFLTAALMTLTVNIRHLFYGITMTEKYRNTGKAKLYLIFSLTDETFSLVCSPNLPKSINIKQYYFTVSILNQFYWVTGSIIGAVIGNTFSFNSNGIEFSMTALFTVIFVEQWEKAKSRIPAISGIIISIICLLIFGADNFLIPSMLLITAVMFIVKKYIRKTETEQ